MRFLKGTKLYSIVTGTCPVCQEESMYKEPNPYKMHKLFEMHERCSHCGTKYKMEPSFFFGAMYVSYALGVAFSVAAFIISYFFFGSGLMTTFITITATLVIFLPLIIRLSRNIWINMFLNYKKPA
ncbi:DUF983 domain-containing protein [Antarcticibacterium arcticum]|uniref:DUF983 domain-containing protein n=1 Tax=Antarcticibacterium arcticum TaxID=2585771 RepID=A0A5B8YMI8_9FLAO|nr:DUF983 domain-containing protein [Antarcticibacterium arcticum]QED38027.1 DUF983 domain-containing protein [Antarcticibacterium arcticum]